MTTALLAAESQTAQETRQYSTFFVAGYFFGIDVLQVQEVLRRQDMTPVPLAPPVIEGLINLRGQIVTALEMRRRLGLPERPAQQSAMNVVVRLEDSVVSLLVDEIGDVVEGSADSFERAPENLDPKIASMLCGIHKLKGRLLLLLDIRQVLDLSGLSAQAGR